VAVRADGGAVREDDAEPEALDDDAIELGAGQMVTMAVKEPPMVWRTCDEKLVTLSEDGAVATNVYDDDDLDDLVTSGIADTLVTSGVELTVGKHYWEVEILNDGNGPVYIGVTRPNLDLDGDYAVRESADGWFISTYEGRLYGNDKGDEGGDDEPGDIDKGDRVGVLLDLDEGSLRFFKNDVQHGPGYPAGSVTGPVVCAMQLFAVDTSARLLPQDADHALLQ
jgi:hypothetical protein